MGILRGFAVVIISVLLFVLLIFCGVFGTLSSSLTYDNVNPRAHSIANEVIINQIGAESIVNQIMPFVQIYCKNNSEIIQKFEGYTFVFPCEIASAGSESIINYSIDYLVEDFYYKDYNCTFVKCFEESDIPLFLVSDSARQYWSSLCYQFLIGVIILILLLILLSERKSNGMILSGSLLIITSLIVFKLDKIGAFIAKAILSPISLALSNERTENILPEIVGMFFSESSKIFLIMFISGIILIGLGLFFKLTSLGFKIKQKIEEIVTKKKIEELEEKTESLEKQLKNKNQQRTKKNQKN